jgi:hypothetical protein
MTGNHYHQENFHTAAQIEIIVSWRISIQQDEWKFLLLGEFAYNGTYGSQYDWVSFHTVTTIKIITTGRISIQPH